MYRGYLREITSSAATARRSAVLLVTAVATSVLFATGALFSSTAAEAESTAKQTKTNWQQMFNVERMCKKVDACTSAKVSKRGIRMKGQQEMSGFPVNFTVVVVNKGASVDGVQPAVAKVRTNFGNVRIPMQLSVETNGGRGVLIADVGQATATGMVAKRVGDGLDEMSNQTYRLTKKKAKELLASLSSGSGGQYPSFF
jgi:hypothetical protein